MTTISRNKKPVAPITREAAAWFSRMRADDVSEHDRARFEQWLQAAAEHRIAYAAFERFWSRTGDYASHSEVAEATHAAASAADEIEARIVAQQEPVATTAVRPRRRRHLAMAASVCLAVLVTAFLALWPADNQAYQTRVGEQRSITLDDGSRITLNTDSRVQVRYSEGIRSVALERGQAYFRVAKEHRPFEVSTRDGVVRALGTAFDVYQSQTGMVVTVAEGTVLVTDTADTGTSSQSKPAGDQGAKVLRAGERVAVSQQTQLEQTRVESAPVERSVAWLGGKLIFDAEPLQQAVAEINRYSTKRVLIGDAALAELRISGVFHVGESGDFVRSVSEYFSLRVESDSRGNYVLHARG